MNYDKWTSVPEENYLEVTIHDKLVQSATNIITITTQQLRRGFGGGSAHQILIAWDGHISE